LLDRQSFSCLPRIKMGKRLTLYVAAFYVYLAVSPFSLAGSYSETVRRIRNRYTSRKIVATVSVIATDGERRGMIRLSDKLLVPGAVFEKFSDEIGGLNVGDRVEARGHWNVDISGRHKTGSSKHARHYNVYYQANFIAHQLQLICRGEDGYETEEEAEKDLGDSIDANTTAAEKEREKAIRLRLSIDNLEKEFSRLETENFIVYYSGDKKYAARAGRYFEKLYAKFKNVLSPLGIEIRSPADKLAAVIFKDYQQYSAVTGIDNHLCPGFYSPGENALYIYDFRTHPVYRRLKEKTDRAVREGSRTAFWDSQGMRVTALGAGSTYDRWLREMESKIMIHEATHQLCYNTKFFTQTDNRYPTWLVEGIAMYFEHPTYWDFLAAPAGNINVDRLNTFREGLTLGTRIDFADLLIPATNFFHSFAERAAMAYAQSWALFYYLMHGEEGKYRQGLGELVRYLNNLESVDDIKDSHRIFWFRKFFRVHPLHFEKKWLNYMNNLREESILIPVTMEEEKTG